MQGTGYAGDRKAKSNETARQPRNQQTQEEAVSSELDAGSMGSLLGGKERRCCYERCHQGHRERCPDLVFP